MNAHDILMEIWTLFCTKDHLLSEPEWSYFGQTHELFTEMLESLIKRGTTVASKPEIHAKFRCSNYSNGKNQL